MNRFKYTFHGYFPFLFSLPAWGLTWAGKHGSGLVRIFASFTVHTYIRIVDMTTFSKLFDS